MNTMSAAELQTQLQKKFKFPAFRKGQLEVIERIMAGDSALAIFPTGAGKSMCYQLPATLLPGLTLVVSPLLSLMYDQVQFLQKNSIAAATLDSTLSREEHLTVIENAKNGVLKVLMISVERFRNERFRNTLQSLNISLLVVDEAHCISEWGHNFRPEYLKIPIYAKEFSIKQVLLLTATATQRVADDICEKFAIKPTNLIRTGFYRKNLQITVMPSTESGKISFLVNSIKTGHLQLPAIIYVTLQKTAESVAHQLNQAGLEASPYHAGMTDENRLKVQTGFMSGSIDCVVATIAFGMGIDKRNIRSIIHYDLPKSIEGYSQEIGRGGRDDLDTTCLIFANLGGVTVLQNFVYGDTPEREALVSLLREIATSKVNWEVKLVSLSNQINIRQLPLKTALVYLEMEGIISSKYSYFSEYQFKTDHTGAEIIALFKGEPADFLRKLLKYALPQKTWIHLDLTKFIDDTGYERKRAVAALEYLDSKKLIQLEAKQAVDVYLIKNPSFNIEAVADKIHATFVAKEASEINRISEMVNFFENKQCLSYKLAQYFGEHLESKGCGHCSVCISGPVKMQSDTGRKDLSLFDIHDLTKQIITSSQQDLSPVQLTRFLCGISSPLLTSLKAAKLTNFGVLENYSYSDVLKLVQIQSKREKMNLESMPC